jgi:hypothetical protein
MLLNHAEKATRFSSSVGVVEHNLGHLGRRRIEFIRGRPSPICALQAEKQWKGERLDHPGRLKPWSTSRLVMVFHRVRLRPLSFRSFSSSWPRDLRPARQSRDRFAHRALGPPQLVELLKIHPELRTCPEPMAESECGVGRNAALTVDNAGNPVDGNFDLARQRRGGQANFAEFFGKVFAWVNGGAGHWERSIFQ